jgi:hypothetical protein
LVDLAPVLERYVVESTYNQIDRQLSTIPVYTRAFLKMRDTDTKGCHLTGIVPLERNSTTVKAALDEVVEVLCEYRRQPVIELTGRDRFVGCGIVNASEASQCSGLACGEANMSAHTMARNRNLLSRLTTRRT